MSVAVSTALYHWSPTRNREAIQRDGLVPGSSSVDGSWNPPHICLSPSPSLALALCNAEGPVDLWMVHPPADLQEVEEGEYRATQPTEAYYLATRQRWVEPESSVETPAEVRLWVEELPEEWDEASGGMDHRRNCTLTPCANCVLAEVAQALREALLLDSLRAEATTKQRDVRARSVGGTTFTDLTLYAIEHSLDAALTYDRPDDAAEDDEGPWVVGADFTLAKLLDFMGGTMGEDPDAEVLDPGREVSKDAPFWEKVAGAKVILDSRPHYSEHDLIRDLVAEVRRLRSAP